MKHLYVLNNVVINSFLYNCLQNLNNMGIGY